MPWKPIRLKLQSDCSKVLSPRTPILQAIDVLGEDRFLPSRIVTAAPQLFYPEATPLQRHFPQEMPLSATFE
jgi:hypothetical protein